MCLLCDRTLFAVRDALKPHNLEDQTTAVLNAATQLIEAIIPKKPSEKVKEGELIDDGKLPQFPYALIAGEVIAQIVAARGALEADPEKWNAIVEQHRRELAASGPPPKNIIEMLKSMGAVVIAEGKVETAPASPEPAKKETLLN